VRGVNRKVYLVAVAVLFLVIMAVPVMAKPTKGLKVSASLIPGPQVGGAPPEKQWETKGGISQGRGREVDYFPITLTIGSDVYTNGYSYNFGNAMFNSKTMIQNSRGLAVWTFKGIGRFEGELKMKISAIDGYYSIHGVLFGFGDFEGQKLMLSYEGPPVGAVWTGYCLIG
jgi:hypothetical protein